MTTFARARLRRITTLARLPTSREPDDVFRWMIPTGFSGGLSSAPSLIKARAAENIPTPTVASTTPGVSLSAPVGDLCSDPVESEGTPAPLPAPPPLLSTLHKIRGGRGGVTRRRGERLALLRH